ncbi:MAG: isoprenylcysteine carboxylmethyltransferase family protein [Dehalococcoidia bacterium]|jgi:protein-S-isoprenylcysteine O-methyltransferase Ste14
MASERNKMTAGRVIYTAVWILIWPVVLLWLSGDWLWPEGWIFNIWFLALCFTTVISLYIKDPALLAERYQKPGEAGQKGWDRYIVYGLVLGFIAWAVIMPLDARRFVWTSGFPVWVKAVGIVAMVLSFILFYRALTENSFASPLVRIQAERKQQVISSGTYSLVRHPMYLAGILMFMGVPLLLGSLYGLLLGVLVLFLIAFRITGEEKMLDDELEGYADYKKKVKYRLMPFIW